MAELARTSTFLKSKDGFGARRSKLPGLSLLLGLYLPALLAAGAVLLPVAYLVVRAAESQERALELIWSLRTLGVIGQTLWLAVCVTLLSTAIAVPLAWLTVRTDLPLRRLWAVLTPLPLVIPSYVGAYLFVSMNGPRGLLQSLLEKPFGITRLPDIYGFPGALLILTLISYPFILLSVRAALLRADPAQEEAARSLGLDAWKTFWRITFPQLRPAIAAGGLLVTLYVLRDFGAVAILRYNTFTRVIYLQYQSAFDRSAAAALSLVLVMLTLAILAAEMYTRGRGVYHSATAHTVRPPAILHLGKWRWLALLFCGLVVMAALVMPAGVLAYWLWRGLQTGQQFGALWAAARNSILASAAAALVAVLAALPVAVLDSRRPGIASRLLERATYLAFALPGIVIALALVYFGTNFARFLYQTLPMLVGAYAILFLPEAVGALRASLLQVHPSMEEAGRSLGKSSLHVFRRITLPLVRPGATAGAGLVFLTTMKELPATLILAPIGFKTLATSIWGTVSEAFFAQAALPALLLILASSFPLAVYVLREQKEVS